MKRPACAIAGLLLVCLARVVSAEPTGSLAELRHARLEAANRPRRLIFNNDGNEPVYAMAEPKTLTAESLLDCRTSALAGTQVDGIFYCTWSSGFGLFTHGTAVGQVFSTKEGLFAPNRTVELLATGVDPLDVMADFATRHGKELFWSFRMNDTHDGSRTEYGPIMLRANRLKTEHPDWMIGSEREKPKFGAWTAVDYTRPEIRDLAFRYVEEVCQRYGVDGVELDFFRHPVFFRRAAQTGTSCDDDERGLMTDLLRRIRRMTEEAGLRRGRPILVAVRVPDSVAYARGCGLDIEVWLKECLVDLLVAGGYYQLSPWDATVALGHEHGVKVYASLDESRVRDDKARQLRSSLESYRGRAAAAWAAGVDGIYMFNAFDPQHPLWRELGSRERLAGLDKDYFASIRGVGAAAGGGLPHAAFLRVPTLNPASPIPIPVAGGAATWFEAGEESAAPADVQLLVQLKPVEVTPAGTAPLPSVSLNGQPLAAGTAAADGWIRYPVPQGALRTGRNDVGISLPAGAAGSATWTDLRCTVRY
jgi:hypothetical protein